MESNPPISNVKKSVDKPFFSLYERTLDLMTQLYSIPSFEFYLFPGGVDALLDGTSNPVIDPIGKFCLAYYHRAPEYYLFKKI